MTTYKALGTTDDVTTCELCGKPELKGTVILAILDADGNTEDTVYAGSTCAAYRVMGNRRASSANRIRNEAAAAMTRRQSLVANSRDMVAYYGPHENDWASLTNAYITANAGYFRNFPEAYVNATQMARDCLTRHREIIATDGLSAI